MKFRSHLEERIANALEKQNVPFLYEAKKYNYILECNYTPDFFIHETIIEAKGNAAKAMNAYIKHWGELKGFSLALQTGKKNLGDTATRLNRMIGFGPLMPNLSQVTDIDSSGNYVRDQGSSWGEYMLHMVKVQKLLVHL